MLRSSTLWMKPKTLQQMFRKLKLAGAHPDVLWGIDAQKAQHNGEEMIRLETLMHDRETKKPSSSGGAAGLTNAPQRFLFWLKTGEGARASTADTPLRAVECTITPLSHHHVVKQQLTQLFEAANILEEFNLATSDAAAMNLESVLRDADARQTQHIVQSGTLYIRGDKATENLRRFGILLVVEEDGMSYLVTLPETQSVQPTGSGEFVSAVGSSGGGSTSPYMPGKSIIGPNGEVDPDVQDFMAERDLRPFDLRMAGSHSSVERFVMAFERIERMYEVHRGRALRPSVCIVISLKAADNFIAPDGSIVLAVQRQPSWEEFLLGIPQSMWLDCVAKHKDWRVGRAPKLLERQRQLLRVADMFHFFKVSTESPVAGRTLWQDELVARLLKEEVVIRRAVTKYNLKSEMMKKRGEIRFVDHLYSAIGEKAGKQEIGFRVGGDGRVYFNASMMSTGQILRVLKDNLKRIETFKKEHDHVLTTLEHVSRNVPVDFSVDTEWKFREEGNLVNCLTKFIATIKKNETQLGSFLNSILCQGGSANTAMPAGMPVKRRMVWVVSDKFDTLPSGVVFIPYDVDFDSIKRLLLSRK